jgi:hypothetical protein
MAWRALTPEEFAAEPEARFGGPIAVIFFAALFALTPLLFLIVSAIKEPSGTAWVLAMTIGRAFRYDISSAYMASSLAQIVMLLVWAAIFVAVTLLRARTGPALAIGAFTTCALIGPLIQSALIVVFSPDWSGLMNVASHLPTTMVNLVAAVAFWAYMRDGRRPNLYYRRQAWAKTATSD